MGVALWGDGPFEDHQASYEVDPNDLNQEEALCVVAGHDMAAWVVVVHPFVMAVHGSQILDLAGLQIVNNNK